MVDDFEELSAHLTDNARNSLHHASIIAQSCGSPYIGTEHLLLGLLVQSSSTGAKILADIGVTLNRTQMALNMAPITVVVGSDVKGLSETAKLTLKMSWDTAKELQQDFLGTEHILHSILNQKNSRASVLLHDMGANIMDLSVNLDELLNNRQDHESLDNYAPVSAYTKNKQARQKGMLGLFGTDLTALAKDGKLDPVVGRALEEERVITILSRRTKNNPVLIGEPGVGKTAIVEGIAERIVKEDVPDHLIDKHVIQLDLPGMIAGTKYRGEFEDRLKKVISELRQQKNIIVFIDELHLLVGAGSAEGSIDAANILKPALARGEIHLIGATTTEEYRKYVEKDSALERRLQTVLVLEPKIKDSISILKSLRKSYEKHHGVSMSDEVIESAVYMANRYINERFMPDKAIDVIDEAAALTRVKSGQKPGKLRNLMKQLKNLNEKMEGAVVAEDYERAALYKTRITQISAKSDELRGSSDHRTPIALTDDDIAYAISSITGIPVKRVRKSEATLLRNLEKHLSKYIIGQKEAVEKVSKAIRRGRSGVASDRRPIGSFVFMGPTGVGKTELARVLAREVFGSEDSLIKIDMSEFSERHNVSRLLGAPAGYVGYDDGGQLTDKIRRQPYSVVLFDEIEKAHSSVYNVLLQILEDGNLTDGQGHSINFSNTIIILTSNLGSEKLAKESSLGFHATSKNDTEKLDDLHKENAEATEAAICKIMRPELINRFDSIITFKALTRRQISKIFNNQINELQQRLITKGIHIVIASSAKRLIIKKGYSEKFGARPLRRAIQDELENKIADGILSGEYEKGSVLMIGVQNGEVVVSISDEAE